MSGEYFYIVRLYKKTNDFIDLLKSNNFDECKTLWRSFITQWEECAKETRPFIVEQPVVTAFEPGLISSIVVEPANTATSNDNPYQQQMQSQGFTNTMRNFSQGADVLDKGYR